MNTTKLASAALLALSLSTAAHAVHLDPGGRGQVLIYPYYTVNKHQQTLVSVTNTASVAQALKVRFNEGYNGREVLDFNLFLSPFDSWTGTIFALRDAGIDSDGAAIISTDTSCTAPLFSEDQTSIGGLPYVAFRDYAFSAPDDGGPYAIGRTREGHFEIYAMAAMAAPLSAAIAHGSNGSPPTGCAQVRSLQAGNAAFSVPTGGLMGSVSIIDVARGTYLSARAEALGGFTGVPLFNPAAWSLPTLADVNDGDGPLRAKATAHVIDANNRRQSLSFPGPDTRSRKIDAVSAVFMADRVYNEFQIASSLAAASDWLLTFPTKAFYVDNLIVSPPTMGAIPPFGLLYDGDDGYSPARFDPSFHDPNGQPVATTCSSPGWIPPPCGHGFWFNYTTNVFPLAPYLGSRPSLVLGSPMTHLQTPSTLPLGHSLLPRQWPQSDSGYLTLDLDSERERHALLPSAEGKVLRGLPVIGFWASNIVNNNVGNGVLANYAAAVRHATSVTCVKAGDGTPCD